MKIALISGCTGQDGALLADFLLNKCPDNYKVLGMTRRTSSKTDWRLKELKLYDNPNFHIVSGDLTDQASIDRLVFEHRPDEIYNLGAQSFVGVSWSQPETTMDITGLGPQRVFESVRKAGLAGETRIYQASSSEMFGGANRVERLNEDSIFSPRSPYGVAKCAAHYMAKIYRESYDMFISCGILFNHESEYRGLEFVTRKVTDGVARIKLGLQDTISLGNLDSYRDWGHAEDYVRGMWLMLQQNNPDNFILATDVAYSIKDLVLHSLFAAGILNIKLEDIVKKDPKFDRPADVGYLLGDYSKAKNILGWKPEISFRDMIQGMVSKDLERISNEVH